jgi:anti-sigma factor RsiW
VNCREFADFVMSYLDGELDATQRRLFEAHLSDCADCVRFLREYRATVYLLGRTGQSAPADELAADMPEDLVKAILTVLDKTP